jgi:hypothetical protein
MGERLIPAVLKTVVPERVPGVRIPLPPPFRIIYSITYASSLNCSRPVSVAIDARSQAATASKDYAAIDRPVVTTLFVHLSEKRRRPSRRLIC